MGQAGLRAAESVARGVDDAAGAASQLAEVPVAGGPAPTTGSALGAAEPAARPGDRDPPSPWLLAAVALAALLVGLAATVSC